MSDLIERLQDRANDVERYPPSAVLLFSEAANEIRKLRHSLVACEVALLARNEALERYENGEMTQ